MQVREALMMTASFSNNPNNTYGYGIINTWAAINYLFTSKIINDKIIPYSLKINEAYPNPFNPTTHLKIQSELMPPSITLSVYNINGKLIKTLYEETMNAPSINIEWNARGYSSGVYFIKLDWLGGSETQKITLLN